MQQGTSKRDEIIRVGAALIHARGYNATGLQEILDRASVPKGSFYFYFRSKEEFGVEIIDHFASIVGGIFSRHLRNGSIAPLRRLEELFRFFEGYYKKQEFAGGCPIGNLSLEMADASERLRTKLAAVIREIIGTITACLQEGVGDGSLRPDLDAAGTAEFIFHAFEGALLHMKVAKSVEPLRAFRKHVFRYIGRREGEPQQQGGS
ncbi:MAG: TetR family transcriptional regulator C-terminal domain-containing protein [Spirochaetes bacterium]|nr:TetR family transcriptional regulator C-terminal domain-containing protein [Spirochaetota bacterium]